jgi:leucyl/phenylalanyl-tRNA--protein transferase
MSDFTAEDLLNGYINGIFPMAETNGAIYWYSPDPRAIIPIDTYKPSRSLRPVLNKKTFEIRVDYNFEGTMRGCAAPRAGEDGTWISEEIISTYTALHKLGYAHSVEAYRNDRLVGGLYGVSINAVFFGESMFSKESNASKVAFHYLIEILRANDFKLLDTQFINDNVLRYGAIEIPKDEYMKMLKSGLKTKRRFDGSVLFRMSGPNTSDQ